jgi:hypothetical protein
VNKILIKKRYVISKKNEGIRLKQRKTSIREENGLKYEVIPQRDKDEKIIKHYYKLLYYLT